MYISELMLDRDAYIPTAYRTMHCFI